MDDSDRQKKTIPNGLFRLEDEEDVETDSTAAAGYWRAFYGDLVQLEEQALARMRELAEPRPPALQEAMRRSNIVPMEEFIDYLRARLQYWERREGQLSGGGA